MLDPFDILGLPPSFELDLQAAEKRYRDLSRVLHPDKHVGSGPGEGYTVNLPVPAGSGEQEWLSLVEHIVLPVARSNRVTAFCAHGSGSSQRRRSIAARGRLTARIAGVFAVPGRPTRIRYSSGGSVQVLGFNPVREPLAVICVDGCEYDYLERAAAA